MNEHGIVDLVSAAEGNKCDEEENTDENTKHSRQKAQCPFSHAEAMQIFDHCLTGLPVQPEATVSNIFTLVRLRELAAKKRESSLNNLKLIHFLIVLLL